MKRSRLSQMFNSPIPLSLRVLVGFDRTLSNQATKTCLLLKLYGLKQFTPFYPHNLSEIIFKSIKLFCKSPVNHVKLLKPTKI